MTRPIDILQADGRYTTEQAQAVEAAEPFLQSVLDNANSVNRDYFPQALQLAGMVKGLTTDVREGAEELADQHYHALKSEGAALAGATANIAMRYEPPQTDKMETLISSGVAGHEDPRIAKMAERLEELAQKLGLETEQEQKPGQNEQGRWSKRVSTEPAEEAGRGA